MKQRLLPFLCALALCLGLAGPSRAAGVVCFTALNDSVLPLSSDSMPVWSGNSLYLPYTVFDATSTGVNVGLNVSYSRSSGIITFYSLRNKNMLVFDLNAGTCRDGNSQQFFSTKAVVRNGVPFVPVSMVCSFFDLSYSYRITDYGMLLRVKNGTQVLGDEAFIDAADSMLSSRLRDYRQSQAPAVPAQPETPAPPPEPPTQPPVKPSTPTEDSPVLLAVRVQGGGGIEEILNTLDEQNLRALFLFSPEQLRLQDDLARRLLGLGHSLGLWGEGDTAQSTLLQLEEGARLLSAVAHIRPGAAYCPPGQRDAVAQAGWKLWRETAAALPQVDFRAEDYARAVIQSLPSGTDPVYLTFHDGQEAGQNLNTLLQLLAARNFTVTTPLEVLL